MVLSCLFIVALVACGDVDESDVASAPGGAAPVDAPTPSTTPDITVRAGGPNRAVLVIGRQEFHADLSDPSSICLVDDGAITGAGPIDGFEEGRIEFHLPPEGWQDAARARRPPMVMLDLGTDADGMRIALYAGGATVADEAALEGASQVDAYEIDGVRASGMASFVDLDQLDLARVGELDQLAPRVGAFAIECD